MEIKFPFTKYKVYGLSMLPTLQPKDLVITFNWVLNLKVGDLVVVKVGKMEIIKRIKKIDGDKFYISGDNPSQSTDSGKFGWIDKNQIIGKVVHIISGSWL